MTAPVDVEAPFLLDPAPAPLGVGGLGAGEPEGFIMGMDVAATEKEMRIFSRNSKRQPERMGYEKRIES